jgi:hypothetical protein
MAEIRHDVLLREASLQMVGKDHPKERGEWVKVMNFIAWNVDFRCCREVCRTIARLNKAPLRRREIEEIVDFQVYNRSARELALQAKRSVLLSNETIREVDEFFRDGFQDLTNPPTPSSSLVLREEGGHGGSSTEGGQLGPAEGGTGGVSELTRENGGSSRP